MKSILTILFVVAFFFLNAQNQEIDNRFIEVKGSAELEIEPNEIKYFISIQEYWKEEFEKRKDFKDYKTKIPLAKIENELIKDLRKVGIPKEDITVKNMGNYYRHKGKEFLYSKQLVVKITDFSKINELTQITNAKGIRSMNIGELNHSDIDNYKKQIKIDALKNAKEKASYLVESIGCELGKVISIVEMNDGFNRPYRAEAMMMRSADVSMESIEQVETIKISYQVSAKFSIK